jgi:NTE family protein
MTVRVAIACQGGGTNGAFAYGVLRTVLAESGRQGPQARFEITALSGTSSGALNAFAAWYGLSAKSGKSGTPGDAVATLDHLWRTFGAATASEVLFNRAAVQALRAQATGLPTVRVSPYAFTYRQVLRSFSVIGFRPEFYDFTALLEAIAPDLGTIDQRSTSPRLLLGAIDILSGLFTVFDSRAEPDSNRGISFAAVRASGTLPEIRPAEPIAGVRGADGRVRDGLFWDGLFSQNPPIRDFVAGCPRDDQPDEIWVVRINPQARSTAPRHPAEIEDRRNELAGNLSLNQELDFIRAVNDWCGRFPGINTERKPIIVRTLKMRRRTAESLDLASKFDRSPGFIDRLRQEGEAVATAWLARWPESVGSWPEDTLYGDDDP